jgi:uncharacterized coiled-coil protein SlyX
LLLKVDKVHSDNHKWVCALEVELAEQKETIERQNTLIKELQVKFKQFQSRDIDCKITSSKQKTVQEIDTKFDNKTWFGHHRNQTVDTNRVKTNNIDGAQKRLLDIPGLKLFKFYLELFNKCILSFDSFFLFSEFDFECIKLFDFLFHRLQFSSNFLKQPIQQNKTQKKTSKKQTNKKPRNKQKIHKKVDCTCIVKGEGTGARSYIFTSPGMC